MKKITSIALIIATFLTVFVAVPNFALAADYTVERDNEGAYVTTLQKKLNAKGYYNFNYTAFFGEITEAAVKAYQKDCGLTTDGKAGPNTLKKLFGSEFDGYVKQVQNERNGVSSVSYNDTGKISFRLGDENKFVKKIQEKLEGKGHFNNALTQYYGDITKKAVIAFQKAKGLEQDGICGEQTLKALFGDGYSAFMNEVKGVSSERQYRPDTLCSGDEGSEVKKAQQELIRLGYMTSAATGFFGPITLTAVKQFQQTNGLTVDGLIGAQTKAKLFSSSAKKKGTATAPNVSPSAPSTGNTISDLISYAQNFLGVPYVYGGNGPNSFDCSGFTTYVFKKYGVSLPRSAYDQGYGSYGTKITSVSGLKKGDLVFFNTISDSDLSDHAGIYIGDGNFIHASSSESKGRKVMISTLSSGYYNRQFSWGRRVF